MKTLSFKGKRITIDDEGYLLSEDQWDEGIAQQLASMEGIPHLNNEQLEILKFMRGYFHKYKAFPILNNVCKLAHQPKQCVTDQFVNPEIAWKVAGLPKQDGTLHFISLDGKKYKMETCC